MKWVGDVVVVRSTEKALLVAHEDYEFWVPKSQIDEDSEIYSDKHVGTEGELVLPEWLARERGLL